MVKNAPRRGVSLGSGWPVWLFLAVVVGFVVFLVNRHDSPEDEAVSLNEIFSQDDAGGASQESSDEENNFADQPSPENADSSTISIVKNIPPAQTSPASAAEAKSVP